MAQSGHALAQYFIDHPQESQEWGNSYLICLSVPTEQDLASLCSQLVNHAKISIFQEPDLGGQLTAAAVMDNPQVGKIVGRVQLALSQNKKTKKV